MLRSQAEGDLCLTNYNDHRLSLGMVVTAICGMFTYFRLLT